MARIKTSYGEKKRPRIEHQEVRDFFDERSRKISEIGPKRAVIYQDKHPDLAERRDIAEKKILTTKLDLHKSHHVLDIGCGTGRWTQDLARRCARYHGIDFSQGLIDYAEQEFGFMPNVTFSLASADAFTLKSINAPQSFDRILCAGVLIYLNDEDVISTMECMRDSVSDRARIIIREPLAVSERLSVVDHFSDELGQTYNAIYRTEEELLEVIDHVLGVRRFKLIARGDLFEDPSLNNRTETRQRWLVLERAL